MLKNDVQPTWVPLHMEELLGNPDNPRITPFKNTLTSSIESWVDGRRGALCPMTMNEVLTNESLMPHDYTRHSLMPVLNFQEP
jgi:hypothetical protein